MPKSDIEEQIDIFMEKIAKSKVPKKASGEAIVTGKPEKVKPPKKGEAPVFWDIGVTGFTPKDKDDTHYGKLLTLEGLVEAVAIPKYASEMSPSLKLMALVFSDTSWAAKMMAVVKQGEDAIPLLQVCIALGVKLDDWGQGKDWEKVEKHLPDIETLVKANLKVVAAADTLEKDKKATDKADKKAIDKAIADGEEWVPKGIFPQMVPFATLTMPGGNKWKSDTISIVAPCLLKGIEVTCVEGEQVFPSIKVSIDGQDVKVGKANPAELHKGKNIIITSDFPLVLTGKQLTVSYHSLQPVILKAVAILDYLAEPEPESMSLAEQIINKSMKLKEEEQVPEASGDHEKFIEQLVNIVSVLDETKVGQPPEQPIVLLKDKGEWSATLMSEIPQEEPLALPPGPPAEEKPGIILLTQPAKIRSPGENKVAVPPTFISIPPGIVAVTKLIWTIPIEVPSDTECQVVVGYGAETFVTKGTFESAGEALPFKLDKGGVLKVSLQTTQPMEAWLELELKIEAPPFMMKLGQLISPALLPILNQAAPAPEEKAVVVKQTLSSPLGSINLNTGETTSVPAGHPALEKKGYKPEISGVIINGMAIPVQELADALRGHLKSFSFTHYMIEGSDHEFKKTKGVLMHVKITWAGDPEANLIKWAYDIGCAKAATISIHYKKGGPLQLVACLSQLAGGIKEQ